MVGKDYVNVNPKQKLNDPTFIKVVAIVVLAMLLFVPTVHAI